MRLLTDLLLTVALLAVFAYCLGKALGAPAPAPKPRPAPGPVQAENGEFVLNWGGAAKAMRLTRDGRYSWGDAYKGSYLWDRVGRTLHVSETHDGTSHSSWSVILDADGRGTAEGRYGPSSVHVYRSRPETLHMPRTDP